MMKRILFLVALIASGATAQDIEPKPLPVPTTKGPLTTSTTTEAAYEYTSTTLRDVGYTSPSSESTEPSQTETIPDLESTPGITTSTENPDLETTKEEYASTSTDNNESTTSEITTSITETPEDTTTEVVKPSTEDNNTTASTQEEPTSTVQTSTEENTTTGPTTTSGPTNTTDGPTTTTDGPTTTSTPKVPSIIPLVPPTQRPSNEGDNGNSALLCRLVLQNGKAYYNWIFRVIIVPKECFFCCRIGYFGLEQCTQINPFFCSC